MKIRNLASLLANSRVSSRRTTLRCTSDLQVRGRQRAMHPSKNGMNDDGEKATVALQHGVALRIVDHCMHAEGYVKIEFEERKGNDEHDWFCVGQSVTCFPQNHPDLLVRARRSDLLDDSAICHSWITDVSRSTLTMAFLITLPADETDATCASDDTATCTRSHAADSSTDTVELPSGSPSPARMLLASCQRIFLRVSKASKKPLAFTQAEHDEYDAVVLPLSKAALSGAAIPPMYRFDSLPSLAPSAATVPRAIFPLGRATMMNFGNHVDHAALADAVVNTIFEDWHPLAVRPTTLQIQYVGIAPEGRVVLECYNVGDDGQPLKRTAASQEAINAVPIRTVQVWARLIDGNSEGGGDGSSRPSPVLVAVGRMFAEDCAPESPRPKL